MSKAAFDHIAHSYDADFTESISGQLQRQRVYHLLRPIMSKYKIGKVLELNCGTGADALWLADKGCEVLATDTSPQMISRCQQKVRDSELPRQPTFRQLAIEDLHQLEGRRYYDLIFSNFGGLNCLAPEQLQRVAAESSRLLRPGGHFFAVVMTKFCWWESLYFLAKGKWKAAWRRRGPGPVSARISEGVFVDTWYYSPAGFRQLFHPEFQQQLVSPVGFFIPPSYMDSLFSKRPSALTMLKRLEENLSASGRLAAAADHFLIHLKDSRL